MKPETQKRLGDFQDGWKGIVTKVYRAIDNIDNFKPTFDALLPAERVWFTVQSLIQFVDNGGLISFYYNSGADHVTETISDLNSIGATETAALLNQMNKLFPNSMPAKDVNNRSDVIVSWGGRHDKLLDELDRKFFSQEEFLENKLVEHIVANGLGR
jgi:Domain of unknown function (DUF4375)